MENKLGARHLVVTVCTYALFGFDPVTSGVLAILPL
jgi:hypothetical protein